MKMAYTLITCKMRDEHRKKDENTEIKRKNADKIYRMEKVVKI